jgi:hypothetical protein
MRRPHPVDDGEYRGPGVVAVDTGNELGHVFVVNELDVRGIRRDEGDSRRREGVAIERGAHGESGPQQSNATEAAALRFVSRGFDDADERDRRLAADLVEQQVWCVRREQREIDARIREHSERRHEVLDGARHIARLHHA